MFEDLTDKNIEMYMMSSYDNPQCMDLDEYYDDMKIVTECMENCGTPMSGLEVSKIDKSDRFEYR